MLYFFCNDIRNIKYYSRIPQVPTNTTTDMYDSDSYYEYFRNQSPNSFEYDSEKDSDYNPSEDEETSMY